ncbi:MAG: Crp/Fnr family transcriptional regulator [Clostridia bacterium]|nr:Crp/Fnr family transcriptional regulator [Clostridia bacterium]
MQEYIGVLKKTRLFQGVQEAEIKSMLSCLGARAKRFEKGEFVLRQGEKVSEVVILLKGSLHIQYIDYWGNRSLLGHVSEGEMFAESYAAPDSGALQNDVIAAEKSVAAFFDVKRLITTCSAACRFHQLVTQNLVFALSEKNRKLVSKIKHMSGRTTRAKLISYLSEEAKKRRASEFTIPFNRQQLADYLSVDRSAMSLELCKMRDMGMLAFDKNQFKLIMNDNGRNDI